MTVAKVKIVILSRECNENTFLHFSKENVLICFGKKEIYILK